MNGPALAGGFEIVLSCDLVVAAETARFGIPEVKRGLMAAAGGLIRLPKRVPLAIALELAMTGDPIDAQRALAARTREPRRARPTSVVDEAIALAERIGENSPIAVRNSRRLVREAAELTEAEGWTAHDRADDAGLRERRRGRGRHRLRRETPPGLAQHLTGLAARPVGPGVGDALTVAGSWDLGSDHS